MKVMKIGKKREECEVKIDEEVIEQVRRCNEVLGFDD